MTRWKVLIGSRTFGKASLEHVARLVAAGCEVIPNAVGRAYRADELMGMLAAWTRSSPVRTISPPQSSRAPMRSRRSRSTVWGWITST